MIALKNIGRIMKFSIDEISEVSKLNVVWMIFDLIRRVLLAFVLIFFPEMIIDSLLTAQFENGILCSCLFCFVLFFNEMMDIYLKKAKKKLGVDLRIQIDSKLSDAIMEMEYSEIERNSFIEQVEFSRRCIDRNSVLKIYQNMIDVLSGIISLTGIIYIICNLSIWIVSLIIAVVAVNAAGEYFRVNHVFKRDSKAKHIENNLYYARNDLSGNKYAKDIRIWHLYNYVSEKVELYAKKLCDLWEETAIKTVKITGWSYMAYGIQYVVIYSFLAYMAFMKEIEISDFVLYSSAAIAFGENLKKIINAFVVTSTEYRYIEGVLNITEKKQNSEEDRKTILGFKYKIEFENVWFKHFGSENYIFKNLNFVIEKNKTYSIVGQNGAGKTTLIKLLLGLYKPEKGRILVDGINISCIDMKSYWDMYACVFQDYNMFGFSISENITLSEINKKRVEEVIYQSGLQEKISGLPEGIHTLLNRELNENATMLSGGQEQQLAIARALYKNSEICILDEPTAALSPNSELLIYQQFQEIAKEKTIIFISHRLASCILCDEIIVLDNGVIVEQGNHKVLLEKDGLYAKMYFTQAKPYLTDML